MPLLKVKGQEDYELVCGAKDMEYILDKHLGKEVAEFYRNQIEELTDLINEMGLYIPKDNDEDSDTRDLLIEASEVCKINELGV